jgi:hypothetical protein
MSATDELISIVYEHKDLLGFLNDKHRTVLDEWKNNSAGLAAQTQQTTDADAITSRTNLHDYADK